MVVFASVLHCNCYVSAAAQGSAGAPSRAEPIMIMIIEPTTAEPTADDPTSAGLIIAEPKNDSCRAGYCMTYCMLHMHSCVDHCRTAARPSPSSRRTDHCRTDCRRVDHHQPDQHRTDHRLDDYHRPTTSTRPPPTRQRLTADHRRPGHRQPDNHRAVAGPVASAADSSDCSRADRRRAEH